MGHVEGETKWVEWDALVSSSCGLLLVNFLLLFIFIWVVQVVEVFVEVYVGELIEGVAEIFVRDASLACGILINDSCVGSRRKVRPEKQEKIGSYPPCLAKQHSTPCSRNLWMSELILFEGSQEGIKLVCVCGGGKVYAYMFARDPFVQNVFNLVEAQQYLVTAMVSTHHSCYQCNGDIVDRAE